ncbi:PTS sugar transporter subunit IIC [Enterococcus sp. ARL09-542]|uniref:PTS mannose/fructose/sorbose/N-acetylgalactosamine transporter subunit IIC n=1 Tax=Enterococcus TaxID=1350 RepID=UPI0010C21CA1|nr:MULTISPECIES: PTS sugar transporter subunit IIC [Enterococcus]NCE17253.1 PTS sugar transporter subunit IIC [Enterococcus gallinarum]TKL04249.1 PTS sugar transporter subunit IIC [Enterococcus sp. ARL09-542]
MIECILIGIVGYLTTIDERYFGASMMNRPIIVGPVVGLILGDLHQGILIGSALEAMFIGIVTIGAALPPDVGVAGTIATALAIKSGAGADVAVTLAMPFAVLAQGLNMLAFTINSFTVSQGRKAIENRKLSSFQKWHFFPLIVRLPSAVLTFLVVYFGANATESFVNIMPEKLMTGFTVASGLLPAVGFAMLIQGMIDKKSVPYFFIGYLLAAYLGVPVVGVAVAAIMVALLVIQTKRNPVNI